MGINDGWQMEVQKQHALDIYRELWPGCEIHENDSHGAEEQTARLLDFGDVDKIILHDDGRQMQMSQRFRKPYNGNNDPDFTLRYSRPTSDKPIEHSRLMAAHDDGAASYPRRYSFGRVHDDHSRGIYELYIVDTEALITAIKTGEIAEHGPKVNPEGQRFMWYEVDELRDAGAVVREWRPDSGSNVNLSERPDNPEKITSWVGQR